MLKHEKNLKQRQIDGVGKIWHTPYKKYYNRKIYIDNQLELAGNLPVYLVFVNEEHCFSKYYRRRESSEVFSIELVLEGSMFYVQNGTKYHVKAGSVFLVHQDQDNEFSTGPEGHCYRLACIMAGNELNNILHTTKLIEQDVVELDNFGRVLEIMRTCYDLFRDKNDGFRQKASVLSYNLLIEIAANIKKNQLPEMLLRAVSLMEHHLSKTLTLKELSRILGTSPASLNRIFQKHFGTSPINYFIELKMKSAKSLLKNTDMRVKEIACRTGYHDALYFSSEFSKRIGVSPREFRQNKALE